VTLLGPSVGVGILYGVDYGCTCLIASSMGYVNFYIGNMLHRDHDLS